ncbi:MAG: coproporphyrinogen III oxidase [Deltaproteobacteria bacterium]|nr:MAG: coproporphyrinogen III oxidase [Pseudomonadota bacterium]PIE65994.1 MAG: coproporphyrinogen III oxidase [Deltaproteobacteria bacterium]
MRRALPQTENQPIWGVYVHYPLCVRRCGYCDFETVQLGDFPHQDYRQQVEREAQARIESYRGGGALRTIYLGGGSPSLWPAEQVGALLEDLARLAGAALGALEVTIEVNPGDLDRAALRRLREAGVDRLSIGVQSLDDEALRTLTRTHDATRARLAYEDARAVGFDNISCDLICGLPDQRLEHHRAQLEAMIALGPEHISVYGLTLAERAPMRRRGLAPLADDDLAAQLETTAELLADAGYEHYEVSNYARPGRESRHNLLVWQSWSYLGLGASAHSMALRGPCALRLANPPYLSYRGAALRDDVDPPRVDGARLERSEGRLAQLEVLMLALRTSRGLSRERYVARFDADPLSDHHEALSKLEAWGLLRVSEEAIAPTARGLWFADEIATRLARA